jgi:hypothetical protein
VHKVAIGPQSVEAIYSGFVYRLFFDMKTTAFQAYVTFSYAGGEDTLGTRACE